MPWADLEPALRSYEVLLAAAGTAALDQTTLSELNRFTDVREIYAFEWKPGKAPRSILSAGARNDAPSRAQAYAAQYYLTDPLALDRPAAADSGGVHLRTVRPSQIEDADYRHSCYDEPGFGRKLSLLMPKGERWIVLSLFTPLSWSGPSTAAVEHLKALGPLLLPLVAKHGDLRCGEVYPQSLMERLEQRLARSFPALTRREREVCAQTLMGCRSGEIARDLGISQASVLTYRRRAYQRLDICSANELLPHVLD